MFHIYFNQLKLNTYNLNASHIWLLFQKHTGTYSSHYLIMPFFVLEMQYGLHFKKIFSNDKGEATPFKKTIILIILYYLPFTRLLYIVTLCIFYVNSNVLLPFSLLFLDETPPLPSTPPFRSAHELTL